MFEMVEKLNHSATVNIEVSYIVKQEDTRGKWKGSQNERLYAKKLKNGVRDMINKRLSNKTGKG